MDYIEEGLDDETSAFLDPREYRLNLKNLPPKPQLDQNLSNNNAQTQSLKPSLWQGKFDQSSKSLDISIFMITEEGLFFGEIVHEGGLTQSIRGTIVANKITFVEYKDESKVDSYAGTIDEAQSKISGTSDLNGTFDISLIEYITHPMPWFKPGSSWKMVVY